MKSEGIAMTILSYYNDDTGTDLGSKLVQGCKRVKEQCTSKRSQFTDVVRKSTSAILVDPKNVEDDENQSDEENDDPQEMDEYDAAMEKVKKRNSKGGYILGEFTIFPKRNRGISKPNCSSPLRFHCPDVKPFLLRRDVDSKYVRRFFKKPWDEETQGCRRCFLALFSNATLNAMKLNTGECLTFSRFSREVTPAIEGLLLAMLEVQGKSIIKLLPNSKTPNMDSNKAEVKKHRIKAMYRRISIKQYFSKANTASQSSSNMETLDPIDSERREEAKIAHQWYMRAVQKINNLRDQVNNKKRKRDNDSISGSSQEQIEPQVGIEDAPEMLNGQQSYLDMDNPDMSDVDVVGEMEEV